MVRTKIERPHSVENKTVVPTVKKTHMLTESGKEIVGKTANGKANKTRIDKTEKLSITGNNDNERKPSDRGIVKTKILTESGKEVVGKTAHGHAHKTKIEKKPEEVGDDDA